MTNMHSRLALGLTALVLTCGPVRATSTVQDYQNDFAEARHAVQGRLGDAQIGYLLGTVETGIELLARRGSLSPPLFCPKEQASIALADLTAIMDEAKAAGRAQAPIQDVLIEALRRRWPCN